MVLSHDWSLRRIAITLGDELWAAAENRPGFHFLVTRWGDGDAARHEVNQHLLDEVIHAADAVEYTVTMLLAALDEADVAASRVRPTGADVERFGHPAIQHAQIELMNLVTWTRNLGERIKRDGRTSADAPLGLLPAMNQDHPIHPHIAGLYRGFNSKVLLDARRLANFGLHASMWPYPFAGAELSVHRTVLLRVPDPLKGDVDLAQQLTFGMGREARTFARSLLAGVATFMDNLLTEFEEASLNRWTPKVYTQADVDPP